MRRQQQEVQITKGIFYLREAMLVIMLFADNGVEPHVLLGMDFIIKVASHRVDIQRMLQGLYGEMLDVII